MNIEFRENWAKGHVEIFDNGVFVAGFAEYRTTAEYAQRKYNLTDEQLIQIYRSYKEDYDS